MKFIIILLSLLFCTWSEIHSQSFNYVHYDTREGLAGSTVYDLCQDKAGFMWFATDNGLSRYDGTRFVNYTVKDGLPDNEVLRLYADSKGRVWIGTFRNEPCFYQNGQLHNSRNNAELSKMNLDGYIVDFAEDEASNIFLIGGRKIYCFKANDQIEEITAQPNFKKHKFSRIYLQPYFSPFSLEISLDDSIYSWTPNSLKFVTKISAKIAIDSFMVTNHINGNRKYLKSPASINKQTWNGRTCTHISTMNGAWLIDTNKSQLGPHYLEGKKISRVYVDHEKNTWFSSLGEGVFKMPSNETISLAFKNPAWGNTKEVFTIVKSKGNLLCGLSESQLAVLNSDNRITNLYDYSEQTKASINNYSSNRLTCSKALLSGAILIGSDAFLARLFNKTITIGTLHAIKSIEIVSDTIALVATFSGAYLVKTTNLQVIDTIYKGRCTKAVYHGGNFYIGTLFGLIEVNKKGLQYSYANHSYPLSRRITDMVSTNETLWVATSDEGIVGITNKNTFIYLNDSLGLSSNICRTLFKVQNFIWVGTNKGVNKISLSEQNNKITKFGHYDGLPSDIINAIYVEDSMVYIGTPAGLTYFNEKKVHNQSQCKLSILKIFHNGKTAKYKNGYILPYRKSNISFDFIGISFKSAGNILYTYKLEGLEQEWKTTKQTQIDYPTLPAGNYVFKLFATNKFGVNSEVFTYPFTVSTPIWKKWWFYVLILLSMAFITILVQSIKQLKKKKKSEYDSRTLKIFALLEQQALAAKMHPHFIHNCLNSIQKMLSDSSTPKISQFISKFSDLVRLTLSHTESTTVTLEQELDYIKQFLEMEALRVTNDFEYEVECSANVNQKNIRIPPMLLQPHVENAVIHGLMNKETGPSILIVKLDSDGINLYYSVEDNGIGRNKSIEHRNKKQKSHKSMGIYATHERMKILNRIYDQSLKLNIEDLHNGEGLPSGTLISLTIPIQDYDWAY